MKHNDSLEKNKYGMLARRHDAINTNKFQSFANTIICIFGRKQFVVQWWTLSRYPRRPAPLLKLYEQQNCADWFIRSMRRLIVGNCCILQLCWPCIRCCSWPLTPHDGNKQWDLRWLGLWVSSFLPLIQFSHNVILSYRYHYCCLLSDHLKLFISKFGFWSSPDWRDVLTNVQWAQ